MQPPGMTDDEWQTILTRCKLATQERNGRRQRAANTLVSAASHTI
jgi:hypothetical protein